MLARLEFELDSSVLKDCAENIFIYEIIPHHLYRALGVFGGPKYALDSSGQATYIANHFSPSDLARFNNNSQARYFTLAQPLTNQLEKSYTKQFITTPKSGAKSTEEMLAIFPSGYASNAYHPSIKEQDFALYFAIVAKIQAILRERYNAPLYVLVWDYDMHAQFLDKYDSLIQESLAKAGIKFWKMSEILGDEYRQDLARVRRGDLEHFAYRISRWDTHPNARANEQIASFIAEQIENGSIKASKSGF